MQNDPVRIGTMGRATGVLAATLLLAQLPAPAQAASASAAAGTTIVRGTAFPNPLTATLSFTGCSTLHGATPDTTGATIGRGPATPPTGARSLGFDLGGGNAVGALFMRPSMAATTTAELMVHAEAGATGVAYAGYQEPADAGTVRIWIGRAPVVAATTGWQRVDATKLAYTWTKRDLRTGAALQPGPTTAATVPTVIAARGGGDGAGLYSVGFGCDGRPFSLDTFRVGTAAGVSTYDLEGLATTTTIAGSHAVLAGDPTRLTGTVRDQSGTPVPDATLILEERTPSGAWQTVYRDTSGQQPTDPVVVPAGTAVDIAPERTATYRFRFADRPLAEGSASAPFVVTVTPRISARVVDRVVRGTVAPAVPGAVVTLWPRGRTTGSALARAEVARDGSYELAVPPEVGGDVVVRLSATPGLQPATSEPVRVEALLDPEPTTDASEPAQPADPPSSPSAPSAPSTPAEPATPARPDRPAEEPEQDGPSEEAKPEEPVEEPAETPPASEQPASTEPTGAATP